MKHLEKIPISILCQYGMDDASQELIDGGLINRTWRVRHSSGEFIVQWVNPIFEKSVQNRIELVTQHLSNKGILTPILVRTVDEQLFVSKNGAVWRCLTYIDSQTFPRVANIEVSYAAGCALARFHNGLRDLSKEPFPPSTVHDFEKHLANLDSALSKHYEHRQFSAVKAIATRIFENAKQLDDFDRSANGLVHGDPKITNFLFRKNSRNREVPAIQALALIDLDTISIGSYAVELGDAFRSWCNPHGEDTIETEFRIDFLGAGIAGYCAEESTAASIISPCAIVSAIEWVYTELAARFCADALNESYFSWDSSRFADASEHNQVRALGQLNALRSLQQQREAALAAVESALAR